jgi:hypothetical protein
MSLKTFLTSAAALSMVAAPVAASAAAPAANPAAKLSIAGNARAATPTGKTNKLAGAGLLGALVVAGVASIAVIAAVNDSEDDDADSN